MKKRISLMAIAAALNITPLQADTIEDLLADYRAQGAGEFDAARGQQFWQLRHPAKNGDQRACTSCHTGDPRQPGRHLTTGKPIDPLAPTASPKRLTDVREIEKWFKRNCKWTLGRECSAQEKGDIVVYLRSL